MSKQTRASPVALAIATFLLNMFFCRQAASQTPGPVELRTLTLGLVSEVNQKEIEEHFHEFVRYVARKMSFNSDTEAKVVVAPSVVELAKLLEQKKVDFYLESPYPTYIINSVHGAGNLLLRRWKSGMAEYRSLIFTKKGNGVNRLDDLRGRVIAFEDPESTSGYFLPKFFLQRNGFKLSEKPRPDAPIGPAEVGYIFAKSQDNLVDMVLSGEVAAGSFSDDDYARLDEKRKANINIVAQTELLPRHLVSVRKDLAPQLIERLGLALLSMNDDDQGRKIMRNTDNTTQFDPLPGGEEAMRRRLLGTFYSPERK